jgi:tetratricopeptide (TPR) repeat protein
VARADRAIACGAEDAALGELRLLQARAHFWLGPTEEELSRAQAALALIPEGRTAWFDAAGEMASACQRAGDTEKAASVGAAVVAAEPDGAEADAARGANAARLATVVDLGGRRELAADLRAIAAAAVECHPRDLVLFARMQHAVVTSAKFQGAPALALRASLAQADAWSRVGDLKQVAGAETNVGDVWMHLGRYAEAEEVLRGVLVSGERLGLRVVTALARHNLGFTLARQGRLVEARTACEAAVRGFDEAGVRTGVQVARVYLADVLRRLGDLPEAEREARLAVESAPSRSRRARACAILARALLERGDVAGALAESRAAMEILRDVGMEEGEQQLRLVHIEALRASGAGSAADAELREAREILAGRAAAIDDPDLRRTFIENIEEHARLINPRGA